MKKIEPFNDVWLDCYNNLKTSLLQYIDKSYLARGYINNYTYEIMPYIFENSKEFYCITEEQRIIDYEEFTEQKYANPENEEEFLEILKEQISNKDGFALMRTDLYDWMEGSVCWHRYHWDHYALIVDYDKENKRFLAFDEKGGNYIKLYVPESKLYKCVYHTKDFEIFRFITLNNNSNIVLPSIESIKQYATGIIDSIDDCKPIDLWEMEEFILEGGHYKDLNGVFLQKIEGRQKANSFLLCWASKNYSALKDRCKEFEVGFNELSAEWSKIRMALYLLYMRKNNRKEKILELNSMVHACFDKERKLWTSVINL